MKSVRYVCYRFSLLTFFQFRFLFISLIHVLFFCFFCLSVPPLHGGLPVFQSNEKLSDGVGTVIGSALSAVLKAEQDAV